LFASLRDNRTVVSLDMVCVLINEGIGVSIDDPCVLALADSLAHNTTLTNISLVGSNFTDVGAAQLASAIAGNPHLSRKITLDVSMCEYLSRRSIESLRSVSHLLYRTF